MDWQHRLLQAEQALTSEEVQSLAFLCTDLVTKDLSSVSSARDLFSLLLDNDLLSEEEPYLLVDLLHTIQRPLLIRGLGSNGLLPTTTRSLISPYRQMLYYLSENITTEELSQIKFLLKDHLPRRKLDAMTTLGVFQELEHKDSLSSTNLELLETTIKRVCPMLKKRIDQFVGLREKGPVTEETGDGRVRHRSATNYYPGHQVCSLPPERRASLGSGSPETLMPPSFFQRQSISAQNISLDATRVQESTVEGLTKMLKLQNTDENNPSAINQGKIPPAALTSWEHKNLSPGHPETGNRTPEGLGAYHMREGKKGLCLIINNEDFSKSVNKLKIRTGTHVDEKHLLSVFQWLGFETLIERNCSQQRMLSVLQELGGRDHSQMDCLVCCVLSHGLDGCVYGVDGYTVKLREITMPFNGLRCPTLSEKPKLFFIQACQGTLEQQPVSIQSDSPGSSSTESSVCSDAMVPKDSIPYDADFLMGMATVPYFTSFRDRTQGTWYIQSLCQNLVKMVPSGIDLVSILTKVNYDVSKKTDVYGTKKQMPQPAFSLRKKVVFPIPEQPPPKLL